MFDALKARIAEIKTVRERALPRAAELIVSKLRSDVKRSRRAGQGRRAAARANLRALGHSAKEARARVRTPKRKGSGISIDAVSAGDRVIITASSQVQKKARENSEIAEWMVIFADQIRAAGAPGAK